MARTRSATKAEGTPKFTTKAIKSPKTEGKAVAKGTNKTSDTAVVRGKPKSGRFWKNEKKKFSTIVKTKGIKSTFEKKKALQDELKRSREATKAVLAAKNIEKELKKERRRENLKRQEENRKKSDVVQVITNTSKIKKMKKKQLRYIEKRDTTNILKK